MPEMVNKPESPRFNVSDTDINEEEKTSVKIPKSKEQTPIKINEIDFLTQDLSLEILMNI
jgi:hypothetical protein